MGYKSLNFDLNRGLLEAVNATIRLSAANNVHDYRSMFSSPVASGSSAGEQKLSEQGPPLIVELSSL